MSTTNNGGPAFPHSVNNWNDQLLHEQHGMSLRDYFAGEGLMGHIVATRAPLLVPDLREDARPGNVDRIRAEGIISFAGVPLTLGDRVLGALSVGVRERRPFDGVDLGVLESLGRQAAGGSGSGGGSSEGPPRSNAITCPCSRSFARNVRRTSTTPSR